MKRFSAYLLLFATAFLASCIMSAVELEPLIEPAAVSLPASLPPACEAELMPEPVEPTPAYDGEVYCAVLEKHTLLYTLQVFIVKRGGYRAPIKIPLRVKEPVGVRNGKRTVNRI